VKAAPRRAVVDYLKNRYTTSERHACRLAGIARRVYSYKSCRDPQTLLRLRMKELAMTRMRYGYRKIGVLLKREGFCHSIGMLYRVYREEGLSLRYRPGRRSKAQVTRPQRKPASRPNQAWSLDFVADQLSNGNRFRCLTIVDVFTRECLAIEVGQRLSGTDVVAVLNRIRQNGRVPGTLFCDNGSEFTSQILDLWAYHNKVKIEFSRPGKPTDNAFIESFNGTFRDECLNAHWFESLKDAKMQIHAWRQEYNESRPHRALGEIAPAEFAHQQWLKRESSTENIADD
jgi:putative transposase